MGMEVTRTQEYRLILISDPSNDVWGSYPDLIGGIDNRTYNTVLGGMCGMGSVHDYFMPDGGQEVSDAFEAEYLLPHDNFIGSTWIEEAFVYQLIANYEVNSSWATNTSARKDMWKTGMPIPALTWNRYERLATSEMAKSILYARSSNAPEAEDTVDGYYYSWPWIAGPDLLVEAYCGSSRTNCTTTYVDIDWEHDMAVTMAGGADNITDLGTAGALWGHWVMASNPIGFRNAVTGLVETWFQ